MVKSGQKILSACNPFYRDLQCLLMALGNLKDSCLTLIDTQFPRFIWSHNTFDFKWHFLKYLRTSVFRTCVAVTTVSVIDEYADSGQDDMQFNESRGCNKYGHTTRTQQHRLHKHKKDQVSIIPPDWNEDSIKPWEAPSSTLWTPVPCLPAYQVRCTGLETSAAQPWRVQPQMHIFSAMPGASFATQPLCADQYLTVFIQQAHLSLSLQDISYIPPRVQPMLLTNARVTHWKNSISLIKKSK